METLDLVRIGADRSPHWSRAWPTPEENPRHARLELWMAASGHQIVGRPANWFDRRNRSWRPRDLVRLRAPEGGERALPPGWESALSRSASVAAGGPAAARRPVEPALPPLRARRPRHLALAARVAVVAAVMASRGRDGLTRPSRAGYIWSWRTGPAGS
jgi:hypothetical protein